MMIEVPDGSVVITEAELEQYQEFEKWILEHLRANGRPCDQFRKKHPKFDSWWNGHQKKKQFDDELDRLLKKLTAKNITLPREHVRAILLETTSKYSELKPLPEEEDEEWDDEDDC